VLRRSMVDLGDGLKRIIVNFHTHVHTLYIYFIFIRVDIHLKIFIRASLTWPMISWLLPRLYFFGPCVSRQPSQPTATLAALSLVVPLF